MAQAVANHIDKEHFLVLWEALEVIQVFNMTWQFSQFMMYTHLQPIVVYVHRQLSVVEVLGIMETKGERAEEAAEQLERLLFILHTLVSYRDGAKITKPESICQVFARRALLYLPLNWQWCKASRDIFGYNRCRKNKMVYHSPLLVLPSFFSLSPACRQCCGWHRVQLCRPPAPVCSSRSPPLCSLGRMSPCLNHSSRRWSKRSVHGHWKSSFICVFERFHTCEGCE